MRRRLVLATAALPLLLGACGPSVAGPDREGELVVFAAASLTDVLDELGDRFEEQTGVTVRRNLAGTQTLATQLVEGAPADVFLAADLERMQLLVDAGLVADGPEPFATNRLAIAVEPGNPHGVAGLADLARDDLVVVLPAPEVPAGRYAQQALARAGVSVRPASLERDVRAALAKVVLGEADAAIVYVSDVTGSAGAVEAVTIPPEQNVTATYPAAVLAGAASPRAAAAFMDLLRSPEGRAVLDDHGFIGP